MTSSSNAADGPLPFSYSKMALFEECPQKYKFKYIDGLKEEPKSYFAFGSSVHAALEFLYGVRNPPFPSLDQLLDAFKKDWAATTWGEKGYRREEWAVMDYEKGLEMLRAYYKANSASFAPPLGVEYSTDLLVDGLKVRIIADRLDYRGGSLIDVVDYKTGKDVKRVPDQLHMYQKVCEADPLLRDKLAEFTGRRVAEVRVNSLKYYHVPTQKVYDYPRADDREIGAFWERALAVAEKIRAGLRDNALLQPNPGERQCKWCDFRKFCPAWAAPPPEQPGLLPPDAADELRRLADGYGLLREKLADTRARLEQAGAQLCAAAESTGAAEAAGAEFVVKTGPEKYFNAARNREQVVEALRRHGLLERVLSPDAINRLLREDSGISPEARRDLLALADERTAVLGVRRKT